MDKRYEMYARMVEIIFDNPYKIIALFPFHLSLPLFLSSFFFFNVLSISLSISRV